MKKFFFGLSIGTVILIILVVIFYLVFGYAYAYNEEIVIEKLDSTDQNFINSMKKDEWEINPDKEYYLVQFIVQAYSFVPFDFSPIDGEITNDMSKYIYQKELFIKPQVLWHFSKKKIFIYYLVEANNKQEVEEFVKEAEIKLTTTNHDWLYAKVRK